MKNALDEKKVFCKTRKVIAVTNRMLCNRPYEEQISRICSIGPAAVILREKDLTEKEYRLYAKRVAEICNSYQVPCILHTFWKVALDSGVTAIHLPLPVLRQIWKVQGQMVLDSFSKIGTSVHSTAEAEEAEQMGASYLTAGHIYATDCKKGLPPRGTEFLKEVCDKVSIPVYGIGGIHFDVKQWEELKQAGAAGGCIMSGIMRV